jgi:hypothetical protein
MLCANTAASNVLCDGRTGTASKTAAGSALWQHEKEKKPPSLFREQMPTFQVERNY